MGSTPDGVFEISHSVALGSTQLLREMSTRDNY